MEIEKEKKEILQQNKTIANLQNGLNSLNNTINNDSLPSSSNININNKSNQYSNMIMDEFNELEKKTKLISDENLELKKLDNEMRKKIGNDKMKYELSILSSKKEIIDVIKKKSMEELSDIKL